MAFLGSRPTQVYISRPKPSDRERVVHGIIRSTGIAVSVRTLSKNIRHVGIEVLKCRHLYLFNILDFLPFFLMYPIQEIYIFS